MKSSAFLAACGAILCAASPILQGRKLYVETDTVTEWVTVTVTEGATPTTFRRPAKPTTTSISTSETPPPPPPPPAPTSEPVIQKAPEPTPESTPEPTPTTAPPPPPPAVQAAAPSPDPAPAPKPDPAPAPKPDPTPSKPADAAQPSDYISAALYHHNIHRSNHSAEALTWSAEHAGYAQKLAETCKFAHDTEIGGGGYGQNLAMWGSSNSANAKAVGAESSLARGVTDGWYNDELELFPSSDYGKGSPNMARFSDWGHFSQVVWKGTKQVGCATHFCAPGTMNSMGSWYTVCNYYPAGNMGGAYDKNVFPPQGQPVIKAVQN